MGPITLYLILTYWVYPVKEYLGEIGCNLIEYLRSIGMIAMQLQSFFQSLFRYVCLFHDDILIKLNLSPNVSNNYDFKLSAIFFFFHEALIYKFLGNVINLLLSFFHYIFLSF